MSTAQDVRRKRIQSDKDTLDQLDDSARHLRQARADAQVELAAAQAKLDAIDLALDDVQNRRRTLSKSLDATRSAFLQALWASVMPVGVLRLIFLAVYDLPDNKWLKPEYAAHNKHRARRPFTLAAVCSRWRQVALDTSRLWTYISPNDKFTDIQGDLRAVDVALVKKLLRRSKRAPLDIVIVWNEIECTKSTNICEALALVAEHSARLRRFYVRLPRGIPREPSMDVFRCPTPVLEQLFIETDDDWEASSSDTYFPDVRNLRCLELSSTGMSCSPCHGSLNGLRVLNLWTTRIDAMTLALISKAAPNVEAMGLFYGVDDRHSVLATIATPIHFPCLHTLFITRAPGIAAHITTPKLQRLALNGDNIMDPNLPLFLQTVAPTVTSLVLAGKSTCADDLDVLRLLNNIESLLFSSLTENECAVNDDFFVALAETSPVIWPKLAKVAIASSGKIIPPANNGVIQLVQSRRIVPAVDALDNAPRQIVEVDLRCKNVPKWIRATIDHLLASNSPDPI